jgi:hypothetical protein
MPSMTVYWTGFDANVRGPDLVAVLELARRPRGLAALGRASSPLALGHDRPP